MPTPEQMRDVEIYALADRIAEQTGRDGPQRFQHEEDLLAEAEAAWEAQQRGEVKPYHVTVIPSQDEQGVWGYTGVLPGPKVWGCDHWVQAASWALGRALAAVEHAQICVAVDTEEVVRDE